MIHARRATFTLAAFLMLLALPFAAQAAQDRGPRPTSPDEILHNPRALARYLRLTPDQARTTQQLLEDLRKTVEPLRANAKGLQDAYQAALQATPQNACHVGDAAIALYDNRQRIKAAGEVFDTRFSAILTPEQLARYEALKEAARLLGGQDS
jgi:Spy/CpxP family protein refolding chaperone